MKSSFVDFECHHRSSEFGEILSRVFKNLPQVFQTHNHAYLLSSTGSGGLEAIMVNCLVQNKKALFINAGKFGERWGKIAEAFGIAFDEIKVEWGEDVDLSLVDEKLSNGNYQALAWQASETSTGALLPTEELAALCKKHNCLSLVDAITALGAVDLPMDEWGIDAMVGGSQKAFMLPTGMAFLSLSERAEKINSRIPSYYFDLKAEKKANLKGKTRFSTPAPFVIGLDQILQDVLAKGLNKHISDIAKKADLFRKECGLPLFPKTPSPSLSCLKLPEGVSGNLIKKKVFEEGFIIVSGQDQLNDKVLRVGHMGEMSDDDLRQTAQAIKKHL